MSINKIKMQYHLKTFFGLILVFFIFIKPVDASQNNIINQENQPDKKFDAEMTKKSELDELFGPEPYLYDTGNILEYPR